MLSSSVDQWKNNSNKKQNKKYQSVGTVPTSNGKIVERGKIDTPTQHIHDRSLSWLRTGTSIRKSDEVKLVVWVQTQRRK